MYFKYVEGLNMIYSVDKLRIKTNISYFKFTELEFMFKTIYKDYLKQSWISNNIRDYRYNYQIEIGEDKTFWFGFCHNTKDNRSFNENAVYDFSIQFNPNKIKDNAIIKYLINLSSKWYIRSYDIAIDIPISILDIIYDMSGRRVAHIDLYGYDNKTIYLGSGDGHIKIYNKKKERNLSIIGELTRVEISNKCEDYDISKISTFKVPDNFPTLYTMNYMFSFKDYEDKTLLAILYAVQNGFPLRDLSRTYRKKVKNLLEGGNKIRFQVKLADEVFRRVIFSYFINSKVIFR